MLYIVSCLYINALNREIKLLTLKALITIAADVIFLFLFIYLFIYLFIIIIIIFVDLLAWYVF